MKLEDASAEYLAGFFDGEGSINITAAGSKTRGLARLAVRVQLTNTHEGIVREFARRWGGTVTTRYQAERQRTQWGWQVSHVNARRFMDEVEPFLIVKRPQAKLARRFWATHMPRGVHLSDGLADARLQMKVEMTALNRPGVVCSP